MMHFIFKTRSLKKKNTLDCYTLCYGGKELQRNAEEEKKFPRRNFVLRIKKKQTESFCTGKAAFIVSEHSTRTYVSHLL